MILSDSCWMQDTCKKYKNGQCESGVFCQKLFRVNFLYEQSLLSKEQLRPYKLEDADDGIAFNQLKGIEENIEDFVSKGKNIYIHSSISGNGKTQWSIELLKAYINKVWYKNDMTCCALFINVPRFLLALKASIQEQSDYIDHIKEHVFSADLVVWDEVGIKSPTQFEYENLLNYINTRIDFGKSNIYTSNLSPRELKEVLKERLYSRIVNLSTDIEFYGEDKRGIYSK